MCVYDTGCVCVCLRMNTYTHSINYGISGTLQVACSTMQIVLYKYSIYLPATYAIERSLPAQGRSFLAVDAINLLTYLSLDLPIYLSEYTDLTTYLTAYLNY